MIIAEVAVWPALGYREEEAEILPA